MMDKAIHWINPNQWIAWFEFFIDTSPLNSDSSCYPLFQQLSRKFYCTENQQALGINTKQAQKLLIPTSIGGRKSAAGTVTDSSNRTKTLTTLIKTDRKVLRSLLNQAYTECL